MAIVQDKSMSNPTNQKLCSNNRTAANVAAVMLLTPVYSGEIVMASDTGQRYRGLSLTVGAWGMADGQLP